MHLISVPLKNHNAGETVFPRVVLVGLVFFLHVHLFVTLLENLWYRCMAVLFPRQPGQHFIYFCDVWLSCGALLD